MVSLRGVRRLLGSVKESCGRGQPTQVSRLLSPERRALGRQSLRQRWLLTAREQGGRVELCGCIEFVALMPAPGAEFASSKFVIWLGAHPSENTPGCVRFSFSNSRIPRSLPSPNSEPRAAERRISYPNTTAPWLSPTTSSSATSSRVVKIPGGADDSTVTLPEDVPTGRCGACEGAECRLRTRREARLTETAEAKVESSPRRSGSGR